MTTTNRIWIELERPKGDDIHALGHERAALADRLLKRMGVMPDFKGARVFWIERKNSYGFTIDEAGGFVEAGDSGHWYNLDYLGRETV